MLARPPRRIRWRVAAVGAVVLASAPLAAYGIRAWTAPAVVEPAPQRFRSAIGQQRDLTLPDGSRVTLDTASTLTVGRARGALALTLDGQAWFALRPGQTLFEIHAGGRRFVTRAGSFDVRTDADQVRAYATTGSLTLVGDGSAVALAPGRLLAVRGSDVVIRAPRDPASITGWRDGQLRLDDVPLAEAVREFNRYRLRPIRLGDAPVAALRVSGVFQTRDAPAFVNALAAGFPVRVKQNDDAGIVLGSR